ncbi:lipoprotein [Dehalogenimonas sp. WBC-2]|nr:lipoprotein [Dehalogenimonas sp. WBC-2]
MTKIFFRSAIVMVSMAIILIAAGCSPAAENTDDNANNNPPATTPVTTTNPPEATAVSYFNCELKEYPDSIWPLLNVQDRQNNFWMEVYYPADYVYPDNTFYYGVQYASKGTRAEVIKHYYDRVEVHEINAFSDVQGYIGDWEVYADVESSFYAGEQVVNVMVGNNKIIYQSNPFFTDFPTASFPAFQQSVPMSDTFHCWETSIEYHRRYLNNGNASDAVNYYRNLVSGATEFSENAETDAYGTTTILKGKLAGYTFEIGVRTSNDTITINLEKMTG